MVTPAGTDFGILATMAAALGISATGYDFAVAIAFAIVGSLVAWRIVASGMIKDAKPLPFVATVSTGLFFALMFGQVLQQVWPVLSLSTAMGLAGFLSSFIGPMMLKVAASLSRIAPEIANGLVQKWLPNKRDGPN